MDSLGLYYFLQLHNLHYILGKCYSSLPVLRNQSHPIFDWADCWWIIVQHLTTFLNLNVGFKRGKKAYKYFYNPQKVVLKIIRKTFTTLTTTESSKNSVASQNCPLRPMVWLHIITHNGAVQWCDST